MNRITPLFTAFALLAVTLLPGKVMAQTTAAGWYSDCRAYIGILRGTSDGLLTRDRLDRLVGR